DEECRTQRCRIGCVMCKHPVCTADHQRGIFDNREADLDVKMLIYSVNPSQMRIEAVDRNRDEITVHRFELVIGAGQRDKFAGADWGKVRRMREYTHPATPIIVHAYFSHRHARMKIRRYIADPKEPAVGSNILVWIRIQIGFS